MLSDPGAVPKNAEPLADDAFRLKEAMVAKEAKASSARRRLQKGWCQRCAAYKPPRAHHCTTTGRCIVKLDHYCPWTNNAVGVRNHKFFLLFIFYTFLLCFYALGLLIRMALAKALDQEDDIVGAGAVIVAISAVLFGLFTSCMLCDQWTVLSTNVAKIDRLKGTTTSVSEINEVFGGKTRHFQLHWLLPTPVTFPSSVLDDVLGYTMPIDDLEKGQEQDHDGHEDDQQHVASSDQPASKQSNDILTPPENNTSSLTNRGPR